MAPLTYKVVSNHSHEISGWIILYIFIHSRDPHLGGMNGYFQYDLSTPAFNNGEQLEDFSWQDSQTPTVNYSLLRKCLSYQTSIPLHEGIVKE